MKLWKKILLALFCLILLAQIPLIYNRFQVGKLADKILALEAQRLDSNSSEFVDYKGVIHVHTFLGGHSTGMFDELISGANDNKLDFVVMTEHTSHLYDTSEKTIKGLRNGTLFVNGNETRTKDESCILFLKGFAKAHSTGYQTTPEALEKSRLDNRVAFVAYPKEFTSWDEDIDGLEVFSMHKNAKKMPPFTFIPNALWSYGKYPELTLARYFLRPNENLRLYDNQTKTKKLTLFAGNDAHSNLGFHLFGDDANNKFINLKFDRYETIFRLVRTHVLLHKDKKLTEENLLFALKNGNTYIGFDILSETKGFTFAADSGDDSIIMGDEFSLENNKEIKLTAKAPHVSRFVIFKNGEKITESAETNKIEFDVKEKGAYRVEVYLDSLGKPFDEMPWIISNPIYIR